MTRDKHQHQSTYIKTAYTQYQVKLGGEGKGSSRSNSSRNSGAAREVRGSRVEGLKSILCGLRPREYRNEYTSKHEGETTPKSRGWKFPPLPSSFFPSYSRVFHYFSSLSSL
ncbi:GSCOCG00003814001-RA-CDS [Cotesia congregata]|nr:GSCOCG00003814001-RA-CDS [Cotesia congregata]